MGSTTIMGVFNNISIGARRRDGGPVRIPLEKPANTMSFVLALNIDAEPGEHELSVQIRDSNGEAVGPEIRGRTVVGDMGNHNMNLRFDTGIPVVQPGIHSFHIAMDGQEIGQADFKVRVVKYDEENHLIVVVTLGGHPLSGWRF